MLDQRSAESHAAYLLPHLKPGHRVLDFGCGPGTISVGLVRTVDPGEVHGIDMEESQIALARAAAALAEVKRVLKPSGIIAAREAILTAAFLQPFEDRGAWNTFVKLLAGNGGHPRMGMELKAAFLNAGFTDPCAGASFVFYDTPKDIVFFYSVTTGWFLSPQVIGAAIKFGLATQEQFDEWSASLHDWKADPAASGALPFGECVAFNP